MGKIFVFGSSNTDMVVSVSRLPAAGETVMGAGFFVNPGGKGANQAVAAARLGADVALVANLGNDLFGDQALEHFIREKLDCSFVSRDENNPSGVALISVDKNGENQIVVAPGANSSLNLKHAERAFGQMNSSSIALTQLEIPIPTVAYVLKRAKALGARAILNPAPALKLEADMLEGLFLISPNEHEASMLSGTAVSDIPSAFVAGKKLCSQGIRNVIITLGSRGAVWVSENEEKHIVAPVVKAVDTTAAGDCFNGALAVALAENRQMEYAIDFACRAASVSVTRQGAQSSMPRLNEIKF